MATPATAPPLKLLPPFDDDADAGTTLAVAIAGPGLDVAILVTAGCCELNWRAPFGLFGNPGSPPPIDWKGCGELFPVASGTPSVVSEAAVSG
jgi:hypothetical protein